MGRPPRLSDSELVCLAVAQAVLGFHSEARWLRFARTHLSGMFPYLPQQSGYNKRLHTALPLVKRVIRELATDTGFLVRHRVDHRFHPGGVRSFPPTVKRSNLAGWATYGYCRSHSRFYWGVRLFLVCTPAGMPISWTLASPKIDEREVLAAMLDCEPHLATDRPGAAADRGQGLRFPESSKPTWPGVGSRCCGRRSSGRSLDRGEGC